MKTAHDLAMSLRVAYLALHRRTGASLARFGLTADQFVLLTALAEGHAVSQKALVERTGSDPNTMSEALARLERRGLVARERSAADGRARSVALSAEGERIQKRMWEASESLRAELSALLPPPALETLVVGLDRVASAMDPDSAASSPRRPPAKIDG